MCTPMTMCMFFLNNLEYLLFNWFPSYHFCTQTSAGLSAICELCMAACTTFAPSRNVPHRNHPSALSLYADTWNIACTRAISHECAAATFSISALPVLILRLRQLLASSSASSFRHAMSRLQLAWRTLREPWMSELERMPDTNTVEQMKDTKNTSKNIQRCILNTLCGELSFSLLLQWTVLSDRSLTEWIEKE